MTPNPGHTALLIDWENFFLSREQQFNARSGDGAYIEQDGPRCDLKELVLHTRRLAKGGRVGVRRAYADFNAHRFSTSQGPDWRYYLQKTPMTLMELGIDPVQVFRLGRGSRKNAADIRMVLDACALLRSPAPPTQVVLVTGDADFIPLVNDLREMGTAVAVVGVRDFTSALFQAHCDDFVYFDELTAARSEDATSSDDGVDISTIRDSIRAMLEKRGRVVNFAGVRPLLSKELGRPVRDEDLGFRSLSTFLREHQSELGVDISRGEHDWRISLDPLPDDVSASTATSEPDTRADAERLHSEPSYRRLLLSEWPRIHIAEIDLWEKMIQFFHSRITTAADLDDSDTGWMVDQALDHFSDDSDHREAIRATHFQLLHAGCLKREAARLSLTDFHHRARVFVARTLLDRLRNCRKDSDETIRVDVFANLLLGSSAEPAAIEHVQKAVRAARDGTSG